MGKPIWEKNTSIAGVKIPNLWIFALVFVIFFTGIGAGLRARWGLPSGQEVIEGLSTGEAVPSGEEPFWGALKVTINQQDSLAKSSASPTSASYILYQEYPVKGSTGTVITASGTTVDIKKASKGIIYMVIFGGTDFYIMEAEFLQNPEVISIDKRDYDADGDLDFIAKLDISDVAPPNPGYQPVYALNLPLLDLDVTGLTSSSPSDQTGIGETEVVKNIEWTLSGLTAGDGAVLTELKFTTNSTDESDKVALEELYLGGQWTIRGTGEDFADGARTTYGDYAEWYIEADEINDYLSDGAVMVYRETNKADTLDVSLNVRCTLSTNNNVVITLSATFVNPSGSKTTVTDAVTLSEA